MFPFFWFKRTALSDAPRSRRFRPQLEMLEDRSLPSTMPMMPSHYVPFGADPVPGLETVVAIAADFDTSSPQVIGQFAPWGAGFSGGAHAATGDVNGDGVPDLVVGSGKGGITAVLVFDGASVLANPNNPTLIAAFFPFGPHFSGGAFVAVGKLDGGSGNEIIVGADRGGGPQVNVYSAAQIQAGNFAGPSLAFYAYAPNFTGGVRVTAGDLNGDGLDDLVTAPGPGGGPQVKVYLGTANGSFVSGLALAFDAFTPSFNGGVNVAVLPGQNGIPASLFCAAGSNSLEVNVYTSAQLFSGIADTTPLTAFYAYSPVPPFAGEGVPGVEMAFTLGLVNGQQNVSVLLTVATNLAATATDPGNVADTYGYDVRAIFSNPSVPPTPLNGYFLFPFGEPNFPSEQPG